MTAVAGRDESRPIVAGPTMSTARRIWLWLEMTIVFIGAPVAMTFVIHIYKVPLFIVLLPVLVLFIVMMLADRTFSMVRSLATGFSFLEFLSILIIFAIAGFAIMNYSRVNLPGWYMSFPRRAPNAWLLIMIAYPLVSVTTQELIYRVFYFHRYGPLFGRHTWLAILLNGVLFAFGHIMFRNWPSVLISLAGGLLFAWRYHRTRSFWAVFIEHSLYGDLLFTAGLGRYFFTGFSMFQ